jgi:heme exporter protein B
VILWRQVWNIVWKDVLTELRTRQILSATCVFALLMVVVFSFGFDLRVDDMATVAPGVLWVIIVFSGILELNHALAAELEDGRLQGLLLAPTERSAIYLGKMTGNLLFMLFVEALILPVFSAVFDLNLLRPDLFLVVVLGTLGVAAAGTLLSTMAVNTRAREVLLPILLFPVLLPVVISAVKATAGVIDGLPWADVSGWVSYLAGFDIIFIIICYLIFDHVVEG